MSTARNDLLNFHRETLVDRLVQLLQESIFSGKYPPKSMISESGVAKEFGVGRVPAREALLRLEEMNLVRKNHLRREIVKLSPEEFAQMYELKTAIETFAVIKGSLLASAQEIETIKEIINRMEQATSQGNIVQRRNLNHSFHEALVSCGKNQKLIDAFLPLTRQLRWTTSLILKLPERQLQSNREHGEIFTAFQQKKTEKLRKLIEKHSNDHVNRVLALMESSE
jgi:DNA-binding GntR family transcriptional regulator